MSRNLNCWEYHNCGREPGGVMADTLGVCPVTTYRKLDGINGGRAAGRACWIARNEILQERMTVCQHALSCHECSFRRRIEHEEEKIAASTEEVLPA